MDRNVLWGVVGGALGGLLVGYFIGAASSPAPAPAPSAASAPAPSLPNLQVPLFGGAPGAPAMGQPGGGPDHNHPVDPERMNRIQSLLQVVAKEPANFQAWVLLGNDYFDTHQPEKAVEAYGKALKLDPKQPDILTDQGVMYRELKDTTKALANFQKAQAIKPNHLQSIFNEGVVYADDLKKPAKAIERWTKVQTLAPNSPDAARAKEAIERLKSRGN